MPKTRTPKTVPAPSSPDQAARAARLLTAKDVAARCQVNVRSVRRWIAQGSLRELPLGRSIRISEDDLALFLKAARNGKGKRR